MIITFNSKGLINETIYIPDSTNAPYRKWLQPAIDWLQINMPAELNKIYVDKKLVKNEDAANTWKKVLKKWNDSKKQM